MDVVELGPHQAAKNAAPPVRRVRADDRHARGRHDRPGDRQLEGERAAAPDDAPVLPDGVHALDREVLREPLHALLGRVEPEVLADREDRLPELLEIPRLPDSECHPIFSKGA